MNLSVVVSMAHSALFFRVMDVVNGLDLRRHLTLGPGGEEFQDQRIASPTLRVSYTFANNWDIDVFASMFSPTVLSPSADVIRDIHWACMSVGNPG